MKDISHISTRLILITGVLVGFLALTTSSPVPAYLCDQQEQSTDHSDAESGDEQDAEKEKDSKEVLKSFEAINSTAQISLVHDALLIETLPAFAVEDDEEVSAERQACVTGRKVLKILFQRIISPNAP